jgi:CobQ-like glutamine amidotransferase family enzyme
MSRSLRVAVVYPDLLGTYGDGGNGLILARRAEWRGLAVELLQAPSDASLPEADIYCLGGGEDGPQVRAARTLLDDGVLARRVAQGAVVLAVCAGFQVAGESFPGAEGQPHEGLALLPVTTAKVALPRAVGEVVAEPVGIEGLDTLTGFENHGGRTTLNEGAQPLATVVRGVGNGDGREGAVAGRVLGTYLHGPVLARNPSLADLLLSWALDGETLAPLDDRAAESLRLERLDAARTRRFGRRRGARVKPGGSPDPGDEAGRAGPVVVVAGEPVPEQALLGRDAVHIGGSDQGGDAGHDGRAP